MHTKVLENNPIALDLYQKLGFKIEKTLVNKIKRDNKEFDVYILTILKRDYNK
jgi:RimJ/RimL family protein N-acetyltransferase